MARTSRWQPKEAWPRPMRSSDFLGDLGHGGIVFPGVLEAIFGDRDGMRAAAPFADQIAPGLRQRPGAGPTRPIVRKALAMVWSFRRVAASLRGRASEGDRSRP